jgi:hypothetical protein
MNGNHQVFGRNFDFIESGEKGTKVLAHSPAGTHGTVD